MSDLQRIEHAKLAVTDLEDARRFYTDAMGLVERGETDGTVYFGRGYDSNFDLAVTEGGTGIEHFAVRAIDSAAVDGYEERLRDRGVDTARVDGAEPGQRAGIRFELPGGVPMEIVAVEDEAYPHSNVSATDRAGHAPSAVDHIQFFTPDLDADLAFLRDAVGLHVSDLVGPRDDPENAFLRCNTLHHDIALKHKPELSETSLHHFAWGYDSIEHMKLFLDTVVGRGADFERGIGRHFAGDNLYAYFWEPGGNRFEMCAEMAEVKTTEPNHVVDYETATTAWGPGAPESFDEGSGLASED
ncbi:VOC family protein [Halobellus rubicundus]|uniref:VOC family protein n=1 Tax=Halobellus rubicundus TaxID=2996466 RepID=A0ABD5MBE9_9EURY